MSANLDDRLAQLPGAVFSIDRPMKRARALSPPAVDLAGGEREFDLEAALPGLSELLRTASSGILYEASATGQAWNFSLAPVESGFLLVGVEALPFVQERKRQHDLNQAVLSLMGEHGEERLLQRIIETARQLAGARYGALGVFGLDRRLRRFIVSGLAHEEQDRIGPLPVGLGILGVLRFSDRPIRIADIARDPMAHGFPPNHPAMHSFLGVPMLVRGQSVGTIYLTEKLGADEFSDADADIIQALAAHAALAVENARLLSQLKEFTVFEERERIRRDLHDGVIQSLYALGLQLELIEHSVEGDQRRELESAGESVHRIIGELRAFLSGLHPVLLSSDSFEVALSSVIREASQPGLVIQSNVQAEATESVTPEAQAHLLQFVREALSNVRRHAHASTASVAMSREDEEVVLRVLDNGRGFDAAAARNLGSQGLVNMASRAEALGGTLRVRSTAGAGSTIEIRFPAAAEAPGI